MLYLLELREDLHNWNHMIACVVRAKSERGARKLAETCSNWQKGLWLDKTKATCKKIPMDGPDEVILEDIKEG